jgi:hypothetical protein
MPFKWTVSWLNGRSIFERRIGAAERRDRSLAIRAAGRIERPGDERRWRLS